MPGTLKTYLDQCREAKMTLAEVEEKLRAAAWPEEAIAQAREYYTTSTSNVAVANVALPVATNAEMANNSEPIPAVNTVEANSAPMSAAVGPNIVVAGTEKKKRQWLILLLMGLIVFVILGSGVVVAAYFVATEKIPMANADLKQKISDVVFAVPFIPKTPKYVLNSAMVVHKNLARNTFDLSVATTSDDFKAMLGMSQMDVRVTGYTDFADIKNLKYSVTADVTREFSAKAVKVDKMVYFKIDKVPAILTSMVGIDPAILQSVLANWVAYDATPLETEARASLEANSTETESGLSKVTQELLKKMMDEDILPNVKVSTDEVDGFVTNKLEYAPDAAELDRIYTKFAKEANKNTAVNELNIPSKYMKDLSVTVWADQKERYVRKLAVVFSIDSSGLGLGTSFGAVLPGLSTGSKATVAMVLKLADFGVEKAIEIPTGAITPEEWYSRIMQGPVILQAQQGAAKTAKMKSDMFAVAAAIQLYMADNNRLLPVNLKALTPKYLSSISEFEAEGVTYKMNAAKIEFLVYVTTPDVSNPEKPFLGIDSKSGIMKNYAQIEIDSWGK